MHHKSIIDRFGQIAYFLQNKSKWVWRQYLHSEDEDEANTLIMTDKFARADEIPGVCNDYQECDKLRFNVLKKCENHVYSGYASSRDTVKSAPSHGDFDIICNLFKHNKAKPFSMINKECGPRENSIYRESIEPCFFAFGHTDLHYDLREIDSFKPVSHYVALKANSLMPGEIGFLEDFKIRICLSAQFEAWHKSGDTFNEFLSGGQEPSTDSSYDVYPIIVTARDAYGIVPGSDEVEILNQKWITVLECCVSSLERVRSQS